MDERRSTLPRLQEIALDDCVALSQAGAVAFVHTGAFAVHRSSVQGDAASLLQNDPARYQTALTLGGGATGIHKQQVSSIGDVASYAKARPHSRSRTLVAATCAGVWIRSLSLILR